MTDDPRIDQTLDGRYVLRRRIGKGGMGVVYEAEHLALERRVAVKLIAPHEAAAAPSGFVERFRREARLASRIAHEHLVHIYDVGTHEGSEYLVMELVVGRDLRDELVAGALSFARAASIMRQLLSALAAIHDAGIVHRDIKPANVMLTTHGDERDYVKLMDFGIARGLEDTNLTKTGHVVGTASFMAPEQLRGKPVDHRSDLYAAGVTLFAMLAGRLPFDGNTAEVAGAHVFQAPPSLLALRPGTPPALAAVVERALAKSPDDRFADARAFAAALASAIEAPVAARAPDRVATAVERPVPPARTSSRGRGLVAIAVAAAAALGGVAGFVARGTAGREATPAPATALPSAPPPPTRPPAETVAAAAVEPAAVEPARPQPAATGAEDVQPAAASSTAPLKPAKPAAKPVAASGPQQFCQCVPTSAPDNYGLCPSAGPPRCRCDGPGGTTLCPEELRNRSSCQTYRGEKSCIKIDELECPNKSFMEFHQPGTQGAPCSGYIYRQYASDKRDPTLQTGHFTCDVCPGVKLDAFRGRPGDPCTGYYWRTGEQKSGRLAHCGDRS